MQREAKTQSERLNALYRISSRLGSTLDLEELLNGAVDLVVQLTGAERGLLVLVEEDGRLNMEVARNMDEQTVDKQQMPISRSIVQRVIDNGEPVLTSNAQEDARFAKQDSVVGYQFRSVMCAPLRARGRVIGAVFVDNAMVSGIFEEDDLAMVVAFANQVAMAIDNARLFKQTDQALSRRVKELELFQQIDKELNSSLDLPGTLDLVLDWALRLTAVTEAAVLLLDDDSGESKPILRTAAVRFASDDKEADEDKTMTVTAADPPVAAALAEQQLVQLSAEEAEAENTLLAAPLVREGEPIGVLYMRAADGRPLDEDDVRFVERLADRAAVAVGNAQLYDRVRKAVEERSKFVSLVTHELRLPLTSIRGYADFLAKQMMGPLNDQQANFVETIQRNAMRMNALISDLSDINKLEGGRMGVKVAETAVQTAVQTAVDDLQDAIDAKGQTLTIEQPDEPLTITTDKGLLTQAVKNLLSNAHKYTPEGGELTVRITAVDDLACIVVQDNGIGIGDEDLQRAFEQFFRAGTQAVREETGWGLGLSVSKLITERLGGTLILESEDGVGTTATLCVPIDSAPEDE